MAPVKILWHSANAWPLNLVFEKLFTKRKKSFELKCCHEVMVDKCYKSLVVLQVTAREIVTFCFLFSEMSIVSGYITRFPEIVARRSGDL